MTDMATALLTRDPAEAQAYASALAPLGFGVLAMPVTHTVPGELDALVHALDDGAYAAIVVTSPRAVEQLARAVTASEHARGVRPALPDVWAVGPATKRALEAAQLPAQLPDGVRDGAELASYLVTTRSFAGQRVLLPRAEEGRTEVHDTLRAAGAEVVLVAAYRTVAVAPDDASLDEGCALLVRGGAAVCAVFAPSQVRALAAAIAARDHELSALVTQFCAIGETTAAALRAAGVHDVAVAPEPTPEGMARAVRSVYPLR